MKLMYKSFEAPLEITEGIPNILVIENKLIRSNFIETLNNQVQTGEGEIVLSEANNILKLEKCTEVLINPFCLEMNQKKIVNKLNNSLKELSIDSNNYAYTMEVLSKVTLYLEDLSMQLNYPVELGQIEATDLIKISGAKIDIRTSTFFENIINYMCLVADVLDISLFVTVNLGLFISQTQIKELFKMANYKNLNLLMIESSDLIERDLLQRLTIIDKDMCTIKNY